MLTLTNEQTKAIVLAAYELEHYLYSNAGPTADYPVRLVCDNIESVGELIERLQNLRDALAPIRIIKSEE